MQTNPQKQQVLLRDVEKKPNAKSTSTSSDKWSQILAAMRALVSPQSFSTWLEPTMFDHLDSESGTLFVRVPNLT